MQDRTPTYAEAFAELTRRLCEIKFEGQFALAQQAGVYRCLSEIIRYQMEIGDGIKCRMLSAVEDMDAMRASEQVDDDQPTDAEIYASDEADYRAWVNQCRP